LDWSSLFELVAGEVHESKSNSVKLTKVRFIGKVSCRSTFQLSSGKGRGEVAKAVLLQAFSTRATAFGEARASFAH